MDRNKIMALELAMYYEEDEIFTEGLGDTIYSFGAKVIATIKKMIVEMKAFANEIEVNVQSAALSLKIRTHMSMIKAKVERGEVVYFTDIESITKSYGKVIDKMRKEVASIGKDFDKWFKSNPDKITKHIERKDQLIQDLDKLLDDFTRDTQTKKVRVEPSGVPQLDRNIINHAQMYISEYVKLVNDLNQMVSKLERNATVAEINFDVKIATNQHIGVITRIKTNATKLLRKSVFAICTVATI